MFKIAGSWPYIIALFLNAFTDLGHKIIIQNTVFKMYDNETQIMLTAIVNALILLPFILLFSPSGFLADRFAKNIIMKYAAAFAVVITLCITVSYYMGWFIFAFVMTFALALQSAIYSPAKYGYIKELVGHKFISAGNAAVQATTTVAILSGIIFYTVLFENALSHTAQSESEILKEIAPLGWLLVIGSVIELILTLRLPDKREADSVRVFKVSRYLNGSYLRKNFKTLTRKREVFIAVIALSIFWSISQVILAVFGAYAKDVLETDNTIFVQGVMALAGFGIVIGSIFAAFISRYYIHLGLVPFGIIGFSVMILLLPLANSLAQAAVLFFSFGFFAGNFIVPLNAYIQDITPRVHLGTVIAGNNFVQNIFMFTFLLLTTLFAWFGYSAEILIYAMGILGSVSAFYLLRRYLLMFIWLLVELLFSLRYKFEYKGIENVPTQGALMMLGNHSSWIDWLIVQFALQRRLRYVMERDIYNWPILKYLWRLGGAVPISSRSSKDAFAKAKQILKEGGVIGLYPEGQITYTGEIGKIYRGFEVIAQGIEGKIVVYYIGGMYGSRFLSRSKKHFVNERSGWRRRVSITYAPAISMDAKAETVEKIMKELREAYAQ
ncbi:MAG TPA: MFS transporter [Helicobacteraceae bacterium]|nr:MFS transporter [Helicobacteraceae bacterium]